MHPSPPQKLLLQQQQAEAAHTQRVPAWEAEQGWCCPSLLSPETAREHGAAAAAVFSIMGRLLVQ